MNYTEELEKINNIRYVFDTESGEFYFSIVDVIENLKLSKDSRNYWKVLKSRLKNTYNQLVTDCNQLKMTATDGKSYLTDVTSANNMLKIIQLIAPDKVSLFDKYFSQIEQKKENKKIENNKGSPNTENSPLDLDSKREIAVDIYKKENCIFIKSFVAGVTPDNIFVSLNCNTLEIKINSVKQNNFDNSFYQNQELVWGKLSRIISLPYEVDIDRAETNFFHGLLTVKLFILDKTRTKILKIK